MLVSKTCWYALWQYTHFHARKLVPYVWIDAICINQGDMREKSQQVQIMARIFQHSRLTLVSLGPHTEHIRYLLNLMPQVDAIMRYIGTAMSDDRTRVCQLRLNPSMFTAALRDIGGNKYWLRLWVLQELTHSSRILLLSGERSIDLTAFSTITNLFDLPGFYGRKREEWTMRHDDQAAAFLRALCRGLDEFRDSAMVRMLDEFTPFAQAWWTFKKGKVVMLRPARGLVSLPQLLHGTRHMQCLDKRDRIYAIPSVVDWPNALPLTVDYEMSRIELAKRAIKYAVASQMQGVARSTGLKHTNPVDVLALTQLLCKALGITAETPEMRTLLCRQRYTMRLERSRGIGALNATFDDSSAAVPIGDIIFTWGGLSETQRSETQRSANYNLPLQGTNHRKKSYASVNLKHKTQPYFGNLYTNMAIAPASEYAAHDSLPTYFRIEPGHYSWLYHYDQPLLEALWLHEKDLLAMVCMKKPRIPEIKQYERSSMYLYAENRQHES